MKTSMKKKALVSSVAMLSVASLALGTATYAWFTQSTHAEAKGITMATSKNSQLQISSMNKSWDTKVDYAVDGTFTPTTTTDGVNWLTANAEVNNKYNMAGTATLKTDSLNSFRFADQLNIKNAGSAYFENVTVDIQFGNLSAAEAKYFRFAIVPVTDSDDNVLTRDDADKNTANDKFALPTPSDFSGKIYTLNEAREWKTVDQANGTETDTKYTSTKLNTGSTSTVNVNAQYDANNKYDATKATYTFVIDELDPGVAQYYNIYAWFEGQDDTCTDLNAGLKMPSVNIFVGAESVSQTEVVE